MAAPLSPDRPICDYEGSPYRTEFWGQGREYEDRAERIALRRLLPPTGERIVEIGAGFGRLADLYQGYRQIVLLDYSRTLLAEARERLGTSGRYVYVAADVYRLPFLPGAFDTVTMVRVIHHIADVPAALAQIRTILKPESAFVLEYANKRRWNTVARHLLGRNGWNPFDPQPVEFTALHWNFHPKWMRARLEDAGFRPERWLTASHFRVGVLKRLVPARALAVADGLIQPTGALWQLSPSTFVRLRTPPGGPVAPADALFRCPLDGAADLVRADDALVCAHGHRWAIHDGIYDFKESAG
jgi:ubiquinone/menaquinone biosynthesis C-methylase UbiE